MYDLWALDSPYNLKFWYPRKSWPHDSISQDLEGYTNRQTDGHADR